VTGILLNHTSSLGLDKRHASAPWLLERYGMALSGEPVVYATAGVRIGEWGGNLFVDGSAAPVRGTLSGVWQTPEGFAAVCRDVIHLFTAGGELLESLDESALPPGTLERAGPGLTVRTADGRLWRYSGDMLSYAAYEGSQPGWSAPVPASPDERRRMETAYRGPGLPWSRILLDLHSGRILGILGPWLADLAAIFLAVLAVTGIALSWRGKTKSTATES
jgi:hypothetical protein